jgi:hypothetical protein
MFTRDQVLTVLLLTLVYAGITFQQSGVFGVCLDIGKDHAGSVIGLMNTSAQVGGFLLAGLRLHRRPFRQLRRAVRARADGDALGRGRFDLARIDASLPISVPEAEAHV